MPSHDPRIDAYIAKAAPFAQPILTHLRALVHASCPEVEETIKWSMPCFEYHGILCSMAAFKAHCSFGFWKGKLLVAPEDDKGQAAMGQFGRLTSLADLPPQQLLQAYLKKAMQLNEQGVSVPARARPASPRPVELPPVLQQALAATPAAAAQFAAFPPSAQRDYAEWISEAKTEATRTRRLTQAIEWIAEGKRRNWKYESC
ncbi:YdeI/OmpD-associated family protein [Massilia sp. TS11]|uniref:YdeI/OmpD-associated family protein n=1 Tax=Massilia sp. TS11 TaxID=2908003 RepID=UPI001EDB251F|nr:YdeI/OmpD-associated family protein [Massilia sp. TS11]MCG2584266.1 YdeI/OmpD-associated family protein [Massilia sp. TS11]